MDLRRWDGQIEEIVIDKGKKKKKTVLVDEQIARVKKIYNSWQSGNDYSDVPELSRVATLSEIRDKGYSFASSKYIEFVDHDLEIDYPTEMTRIQNEMCELLTLEKNSQTMLTDAFRGIGYDIE
ncbi:MAG: SAM-dependent DNA methyltransferase [Quinella sp. 1Q7]|nr:SAM-dependent DNA methyltransferase [Quinella sp. 1Q7]